MSGARTSASSTGWTRRSRTGTRSRSSRPWPAAEPLQTPLHRFAQAVRIEARGGRQAPVDDPTPQVRALGEPRSRRRQRLRTAVGIGEQAVLPVAQVLARAPAP